MLNIVFIFIFSVLAYQVCSSVSKQSAIFREFGQPLHLGVAALLFPFGPIALLVIPALGFSFWLGAIAMLLCYAPAVVTARRATKAFEVAGTDRVRRAQEAASKAMLAGILGFIYMAVITTYSAVVSGYANSP